MNRPEWKCLRNRAGLSQYEAGRLIDVPSYEISRLETGRDSAIRGEKLEALRAALEARARSSACAHAEGAPA